MPAVAGIRPRNQQDKNRQMRQPLGILPGIYRANAERKESRKNSQPPSDSARRRSRRRRRNLPRRSRQRGGEIAPGTNPAATSTNPGGSPRRNGSLPSLLPGSPRNKSLPARDAYSSRTVPFRKCGNRPPLTHQHDWRSSYKPPIRGHRHGRRSFPHPIPQKRRDGAPDPQRS